MSASSDRLPSVGGLLAGVELSFLMFYRGCIGASAGDDHDITLDVAVCGDALVGEYLNARLQFAFAADVVVEHQ